MKFKFKDRMFTDPLYAPYYSKYKGHHFVVLSYPHAGHAEVACVSNPNLKVDGIIHISDIERVFDGNQL